MFRTLGTLIDPNSMVSTIQLNDPFRCWTREVSHETTDGVLTPELPAIKLLRLQ